MVNRRPTPELERARKWEIAKRYSKRGKLSKRGRSMAAIRVSELSRWMDHEYGPGVELDPNTHSEMVARIMAHHFMCLPDGARRLSSWFDRYCPWIQLRDREYLIGEAIRAPLKWSADKLAWKLRINMATRTALKFTTIGAIDCNREQRAQLRKAKRAELMRALRAKRKAEASA